MHHLYLGYSTTLNADSVVLLFDPYYREGSDHSFFEEQFDAAYIRPEDFEVYGKEDCGGEFTYATLSKLPPFMLPANIFDDLQLCKLESFFFFENKPGLRCVEKAGVVLWKPLVIERYFFEK